MSPRCAACPVPPAISPVDWQRLFGRFREGQPRFPELDRRHVARRRVDPEVVVPVHVARELGPELSRRVERLVVYELGLQYPVGRLVDGVVVGAALGRRRPLYAEGLEHQVDLGVVELAAAVRVEYLDVRDGEGGRRERRLDRSGVFPGPGGVTDDLPVVEVDEQADVVPRGPDAHVGQVAAYMGARRPAVEAARDGVGHVGLVGRPGVHLEPLPAVRAGQAVLPHDAAGPAPADGGARPPGDAFILREPYRPLLAAWAAAMAGAAGYGAAGRPGRERMEQYIDLATPRSPHCIDMGWRPSLAAMAPTFERISAPPVLRCRPPSGACGSRARAPGSGPARASGCPRRAASRSRLST